MKLTPLRALEDAILLYDCDTICHQRDGSPASARIATNTAAALNVLSSILAKRVRPRRRFMAVAGYDEPDRDYFENNRDFCREILDWKAGVASAKNKTEANT